MWQRSYILINNPQQRFISSLRINIFSFHKWKPSVFLVFEDSMILCLKRWTSNFKTKFVKSSCANKTLPTLLKASAARNNWFGGNIQPWSCEEQPECYRKTIKGLNRKASKSTLINWSTQKSRDLWLRSIIFLKKNKK